MKFSVFIDSDYYTFKENLELKLRYGVFLIENKSMIVWYKHKS